MRSPGDIADTGDSEVVVDGRLCAAALDDLDRHGLAAIVRILRTVLSGMSTHNEDDIARRLRVAPRHRWLLRRWLRELVARELLSAVPDGYTDLREPPAPARSSLAEACAVLGFSPHLARFFDQANRQLPMLLQDRLLPQELLFPGGDFLTAEAAYRDNPVNRYLNAAARELVVRAVRELGGDDHTPVRILELGAGVGGTTADIVTALRDFRVDYHFTDLSTFFLTHARGRFADYPWMRYGIVDLNCDLATQPPCDIVLAANVLHNAQDCGELLGVVSGLLTPGGYLIFVESCIEHAQLLTSMHFLMSARPGGTQPGQTDARAGTDRIFLHENQWLAELATAELIPLPTRPPADHSLAPHGQRLFAARKPIPDRK